MLHLVVVVGESLLHFFEVCILNLWHHLFQMALHKQKDIKQLHGGWSWVVGGAVWWVELSGGWSCAVGGAMWWVELSCIIQMHTFIYYTQAVFNHIGMFTRVFKQIDISRMYRLNYNPSRGFLPWSLASYHLLTLSICPLPSSFAYSAKNKRENKRISKQTSKTPTVALSFYTFKILCS